MCQVERDKCIMYISTEFICRPIDANDEVPWSLRRSAIGATGKTPPGPGKCACRTVHTVKELTRTGEHRERCGVGQWNLR